MRLLLFLVFLWIPLSAVKCIKGYVIQDGLLIPTKQQQKLIDYYSEESLTGSCYFILQSINCSKESFNVIGRTVTPFPRPMNHLSDCWENNDTLICDCNNEDYCNIRMYDLLEILQSDEQILNGRIGGKAVSCHRKLLSDSVPALLAEPDTNDQYPPSFRWWYYPLIVTAAINVIGFLFHFGDKVDTCLKKRRATKEAARILKLNQEAKLKCKSSQYHYLWPLRNDHELLQPKNMETRGLDHLQWSIEPFCKTGGQTQCDVSPKVIDIETTQY